MNAQTNHNIHGKFDITVVTVVRNGERVISECIESVLSQGIDRLEYIIVDGASTDNTLEIIRGFGDAVTQCISEPDTGLYDAMNKGLRHARGYYVHFLNSDDRYSSEDTLKRVMPLLDSQSVCHGQMYYVNSSGDRKLLGEPFSRKRELKASRMPQPAMIVPRFMYEKVGEFDTNYRIAADYDMVLRLTEHYPAHFVPVPITVMHTGGISFQRPDLAFGESLKVARKHGRSWIGSLTDFALKHL